MWENRLAAVHQQFRSRTQTSFGVLLTLIGFLFLALSRTVSQGPSVLLRWMPSPWVGAFILIAGTLVLAAVVRACSSLLSRIVFRRSLRVFFREQSWSFEDNLPLTLEVGAVLGIPRSEEEDVEGYVKKVRQALHVPRPSRIRRRRSMRRQARLPEQLPF